MCHDPHIDNAKFELHCNDLKNIRNLILLLSGKRRSQTRFTTLLPEATCWPVLEPRLHPRCIGHWCHAFARTYPQIGPKEESLFLICPCFRVIGVRERNPLKGNNNFLTDKPLCWGTNIFVSNYGLLS
jgi:hypothetical protein